MPRYDAQSRRQANELGDASADMTVVPYRPPFDEGTPLLPGKTKQMLSPDRVRFLLSCFGAVLVFLLVAVNLGLHVTYCPLYPSAMDAVRRDWDKEVAQHGILREEWHLKEQQHAVVEEEWERAAEWHERDVARRIREENERQEQVRWEWAQEDKRRARESDAYEQAVARRVHEEHERRERAQKEWDDELREHDKDVAHRARQEEARQEVVRTRWAEEVLEHEKDVSRRSLEEEQRQERIREEWAEEMEQYRHECEEMERRENSHREHERQRWRREVEDHDQIEEEHRKHEEEERQKLNMFWDEVEAHTCTTYAAREYSARLMNLPTTWEHRVEACKVTPLKVHGISYLPKSCEDKGPGYVIGKWEINQHEPDCAAYWNWYKDKGCTSPGSGKRRIEHYLENLPKGGDWREFCATTPARFHGLEFDGAQECFQFNSGTYGHWEIDDTSC